MSIEISRLSNGLTIVTDPMPGLESATLGIWANTGARFERADETGLAHLLEHMAFKGTARRSAQAIAEEIEAVGGYLNAWTSREQTAYYARVLAADMPLALDLIADILQNAAFAEDELARERHVVIQEIGESRDTPDDIVFDHLQAAAYPDQPMGCPILGTPQSVSGFGAGHLRSFVRRCYRAPAMALIAAGAVDHGDLARRAEALFAGLPSGSHAVPAPLAYRGGEMRADDDLEQVHLALGFPAPAAGAPEAMAAHLYAAILGGGMSSRLFQEAREKRGLCYAISAQIAAYCDGGLLTVYAGTGAEDSGRLLDVVAGQMKALADGPGADELARAKAQARAGLLMARERPSARCEQIAGDLLVFGRVRTPAEIVAAVDAVDAAAIRAAAAHALEAGPLSLGAVGPLGRVPERPALQAMFA